MPHAAIGIEIGGTKLQSAVVTATGEVLRRRARGLQPRCRGHDREAVARQLEPLPMETMRPAPPVRLVALGEDVVLIDAALVALQATAGDDAACAARV